MAAHAIAIHTQVATDAEPTGAVRYRWRCACGRDGAWRTARHGGSPAIAARSARTGGARHVAAMERGR